MKRQYIKCECMVNGQPCGNKLAFIANNKVVFIKYGRTIEVDSGLGNGNIVVTCEKCKGKTTIQAVTNWRIKN